ncbi:MAG: transcriptional repressor [Phycisphaerae bacterium]
MEKLANGKLIDIISSCGKIAIKSQFYTKVYMADRDLKKEAGKILKAGNLNYTKAQVLIMQELLKTGRPLSREELSGNLGHSSPDKATIYRIMEKLCAKNLVHKVYLSGQAWKYELAHNCMEKQCHPHFTCINCGETFCLTGLFLPLIKGLKKGFVIHRQQVGIEGLCSSCS